MVSTPNNGRAPRRGRAVDLGISRSSTPFRIVRRPSRGASRPSAENLFVISLSLSPPTCVCARAPSFGRKRLKKPFEKKPNVLRLSSGFFQMEKKEESILEIFTPKPRLEGLPPQQGISTLPRRPPPKAPGISPSHGSSPGSRWHTTSQASEKRKTTKRPRLAAKKTPRSSPPP